MSNYFSYFPTIEHDLKNDNTNIVTVKNILKRCFKNLKHF